MPARLPRRRTFEPCGISAPGSKIAFMPTRKNSERGTLVGTAHLEPGERITLNLPESPRSATPINASPKRGDKSKTLNPKTLNPKTLNPKTLNPGESVSEDIDGATTVNIVNTDSEHAIDVEIRQNNGVLEVRVVKQERRKRPNGESYASANNLAAACITR